jgi:hypothetical protein
MCIGGFFVCRGACLTHHPIDVVISVHETRPEAQSPLDGRV